MDLTDKVGRRVGKHFVSLSCRQIDPRLEEPKLWMFSGFVVEILDEWFYITAGHIIRDIKIAIDSGSTFDVWRLGDQTASDLETRKRHKNMAVPYDFNVDHWYVLRDEALGLDYAVTHLSTLYRKQLEAGGVLPFKKDLWLEYSNAGSIWGLAGVPSETVTYDGTTHIDARFTLLGLTPADPPPAAGQKAKNQFYAVLHSSSQEIVGDIDGMSGGPVVAVMTSTEGFAYFVIGVQSAWYPDSRLIAACPFSSFALALEPIIDEALREWTKLNGH